MPKQINLKIQKSKLYSEQTANKTNAKCESIRWAVKYLYSIVPVSSGSNSLHRACNSKWVHGIRMSASTILKSSKEIIFVLFIVISSSSSSSSDSGISWFFLWYSYSSRYIHCWFRSLYTVLSFCLSQALIVWRSLLILTGSSNKVSAAFSNFSYDDR